MTPSPTTPSGRRRQAPCRMTLSRRWALAAVLAALSLAGCYEARMQWSPDGTRAAVRTRYGLYLGDAVGRLSPMLLPDVRAVSWMHDGQRLVVATDADGGQRLAIAQLEGGTLTLGTPLYTGPGVIDIRVSPDDRLIAFTASLKRGSEELKLFLVPADGSQSPALVADQVAAHPDWTADGRAIVYFQASARGSAGSDELRLGVLVEHSVTGADHAIEIAPKPVYLAGVLFNDFARVRCLRDGRVLFSAPEMQLPFATADASSQREQFFAIDRARQSTLSRMIPRQSEALLPQGLSFFDVSPGEDQVLFGSPEGDVDVLTLSTGQVEQVQTAAKGEMQGAPTWRADSTFTYVRRGGATERPAEIVEHRGAQEAVYSAGWPNRLLEDLTDMSP